MTEAMSRRSRQPASSNEYYGRLGQHLAALVVAIAAAYFIGLYLLTSNAR